MFCVITPASSPRRSSSASARCAPLGCLPSQRARSAGRRSPRSAPGRAGRRRCGRPPSGRRSPTARCRASGSPGSPTGTEIPAPVSATTEPAERISSASAAAAGAHFALELRRRASRGRRRCPRARPRTRTPSERLLLGRDARRRGRPGGRPRLICSSASGAWPRELARPRERGVEQLVVRHDAVDEPVLVGVLGRDRLAGGVHLERLGRARRAAAAAACRRSPG